MQETKKKMKHSNSMEENTHPDDTDSNTLEPQQPVTKEPATTFEKEFIDELVHLLNIPPKQRRYSKK